MHTSSLRLTQGRRRGAILALPALFGAALSLAACTSPSAASTGSSPYGSTAPSPSKAPATAATGSALAVRSTSLGTILTDGRGFTLYAFEADKGTTSACSGACAMAWPPVTTAGTSPQIGTGVTKSLVGQTTRPDGTTQLTYAGHPVYLFVKDTAPGTTSGQGLQAFGARWDVLTAAGQEVTTGTSSMTASPATSAPSSTSTSGRSPSPTCTIPQNNGGDHDADNNGGPDDGDGCDK
jgi:predicted lipoprotein with Yx(FWY)xxD motif